LGFRRESLAGSPGLVRVSLVLPAVHH
jgi:hypothetical protein